MSQEQKKSPEEEQEKLVESKSDLEINAPELEFSVVAEVASYSFSGEEDETEHAQQVTPNLAAPVHAAPQSASAQPNIIIDSSVTKANVEVVESLKLIAIFSGESKLLESEMNKIIKMVYKKSPQLKPYLMKMKKLLKDHAHIESLLAKLEPSAAPVEKSSPSNVTPIKKSVPKVEKEVTEVNSTDEIANEVSDDEPLKLAN